MTIELKNKDGDVIPPRPSIFDDKAVKERVIKMAVEKLFRSKHCSFEIDEKDDLIDSLIELWDETIDAYELAKDFEQHHHHWIVNLDLIYKLDQVGYWIEREYHKEIEYWFIRYQPVPPFEVGTKLIDGVITDICPHNKATYLVLKNCDAADSTTRLLVKFEDAVLAQ